MTITTDSTVPAVFFLFVKYCIVRKVKMPAIGINNKAFRLTKNKLPNTHFWSSIIRIGKSNNVEAIRKFRVRSDLGLFLICKES